MTKKKRDIQKLKCRFDKKYWNNLTNILLCMINLSCNIYEFFIYLLDMTYGDISKWNQNDCILYVSWYVTAKKIDYLFPWYVIESQKFLGCR